MTYSEKCESQNRSQQLLVSYNNKYQSCSRCLWDPSRWGTPLGEAEDRIYYTSKGKILKFCTREGTVFEWQKCTKIGSVFPQDRYFLGPDYQISVLQMCTTLKTHLCDYA